MQCGFSSCAPTGACNPDALAVIVTPDAIAIERKTSTESPVSIPLDEFFNLEHTEVILAYNPTNGVLETGDGATLIYEPNAGFKGSEVLEYSLCTVVEPVLCDKSTITFVVGAADANQVTNQTDKGSSSFSEGEVISEALTSEEGSQESASTSMISIGAAIGAFLVLSAAVVWRKRNHATNDGFKGIPELITTTSTPPDKGHPHGSSLEHTYADCNNLSVTSFLSGEKTSPYGPQSKRSLLKKSKQSSSGSAASSSIFSNVSIKSKKTAVVEDVVDL